MKITIDFKDPKTEKPNPKNEFEYFLIVDKNGWMGAVTYSSKFDLFNASNTGTLKEAQKTAIQPRYWAEIPPELLAQEDCNEQTE